MFSRSVTSSYSPPDDVMSSNCNDVAPGSGAEGEEKKEEKKRSDGRGMGSLDANFLFFFANLVY